jgi:hypothetical protein
MWLTEENRPTMGTLSGMTREDSERIGFVLSALGCEAITTKELRHWCKELIRMHELSELPDYVLELLEFEESFAKVFKVVGFVPDGGLKQQDRNALFGIAVLRGVAPMDWPVKKDAALRALEVSPRLKAKFCAEFPFVKL